MKSTTTWPTTALLILCFLAVEAAAWAGGYWLIGIVGGLTASGACLVSLILGACFGVSRVRPLDEQETIRLDAARQRASR